MRKLAEPNKFCLFCSYPAACEIFFRQNTVAGINLDDVNNCWGKFWSEFNLSSKNGNDNHAYTQFPVNCGRCDHLKFLLTFLVALLFFFVCLIFNFTQNPVTSNFSGKLELRSIFPFFFSKNKTSLNTKYPVQRKKKDSSRLTKWNVFVDTDDENSRVAETFVSGEKTKCSLWDKCWLKFNSSWKNNKIRFQTSSLHVFLTLLDYF